MTTPGFALITGASSGIGMELATIHASRGGNCLLIARREQRLQELQKHLSHQYGVDVHVFSCDLTEPNAIDRIWEYCTTNDLQIDILINNAGFGARGEFVSQDINTLSLMIQLNCIALTALTHKFLPQMVKRGQGKVLQVGSTAGMIPGPLQAVYFATKAYVNSLSDAVGYELRNTGVTMTLLAPGPVKTEFAQVADMGGTSSFENTAGVHEVAQDAYDAMIRGKRITHGPLPFMFKLLLKIAPLFPRYIVLKMVARSQRK